MVLPNQLAIRFGGCSFPPLYLLRPPSRWPPLPPGWRPLLEKPSAPSSSSSITVRPPPSASKSTTTKTSWRRSHRKRESPLCRVLAFTFSYYGCSCCHWLIKQESWLTSIDSLLPIMKVNRVCDWKILPLLLSRLKHYGARHQTLTGMALFSIPEIHSKAQNLLSAGRIWYCLFSSV